MRTYGAKNSDSQIKNSPVPTESQFAKFNAHQIFPLYSMQYLCFIHPHSIFLAVTLKS